VALSKQKIVLFLTTGAYAGYFPKMPGTAGTVVAIPISLALNRFAEAHLFAALLTLFALVLISIRLATEAAETLNQKDPQIIVIDEIVGFLIANFTAAPHWPNVLAAFALFRFFDTTKVFPINELEKLPGGSGIVLDDALAGLYSFLILRMLGWSGLL
jgi:phosphatidylglycerophosphatase A